MRIKRVRWLNRTVLAVGLANVFSDVGQEMATAAMPALIAGLRGSVRALGVIEGVADGAASVTRFLSGTIIGRLARRKPLAVIGYFMTAAGMATRLERRFDEAVAHVGSRTARAWRLYVGVSAVAFRIGCIGIYQTLLAKRSEAGTVKCLPRTRRSWQDEPLTRSTSLPATA